MMKENIKLEEEMLGTDQQNNIQEGMSKVPPKTLSNKEKGYVQVFQEQKELKARLSTLENECLDREEKRLSEEGDQEALKHYFKEKYRTTIEALRQELHKAQAEIQTLLVDQGLEVALNKTAVRSDMREAVKALLKTKLIVIEAQENGPVALLEGEPLLQAVLAWAKSSQGQPFLALPDNRGGGARTMTTTSSPENPYRKDSYNLTEQGRLEAKNPTMAALLRQQATS